MNTSTHRDSSVIKQNSVNEMFKFVIASTGKCSRKLLRQQHKILTAACDPSVCMITLDREKEYHKPHDMNWSKYAHLV